MKTSTIRNEDRGIDRKGGRELKQLLRNNVQLKEPMVFPQDIWIFMKEKLLEKIKQHKRCEGTESISWPETRVLVGKLEKAISLSLCNLFLLRYPKK